MIDGHEFVKLDKSWVFDKTDFTCYYVEVNEDNAVEDKKKAFKVRTLGGETYVKKYMKIPVKIEKMALKLVDKIKNYE